MPNTELLWSMFCEAKAELPDISDEEACELVADGYNEFRAPLSNAISPSDVRESIPASYYNRT